MALPIYVHIPFCVRKCRYCDFNSFAGRQELIAPYVRALALEIDRAGALLVPTVERRTGSVYIGGGTPSLLAPDQVSSILAAISRSFPLAPDAEITTEANPGTVAGPWLSRVREAGVTRLSLGVQALDDASLRSLGRIHTAEEAVQAVAAAKMAGFGSMNIDLMYGLPGQTLEGWLATLESAAALEADHFSLYALTVEDETPLGRDVRAGLVTAPDDDLMAEMYEQAEVALARAGYQQYEISNWARPGHECRHNLAYWRNLPFLGFGAGAHSSFDPARLTLMPAGEGRDAGAAVRSARWSRWQNTGDPEEYIRGITAGQSPLESVEWLTRAQSMWETTFLGLRLVREGLVADQFVARFGTDLDAAFGHRLAELAAAGLIERDITGIRLTARGRLLSNEVFVRLAPEGLSQPDEDEEEVVVDQS